MKLPAGKYYIGDPCYVIDSDNWGEFLDSFWVLDNIRYIDRNGGIFDFDGYACCAFYTLYGDGQYEASNGAMLGVDAAMIGAIPLVLCTRGDMNGPDSDGTVVEFHEPFECARDYDGLLHFGNVTVMTGEENGDSY